jgi:hypothetical protein
MPDTAAIKRAKGNRQRLDGENLTKIDQNSWLRSFEVSIRVHATFTALQRFLEVGADPDPAQAVPYETFDCSTGLVWRIIMCKNYPCLQFALRFGAPLDKLNWIDPDCEPLTPLAYCAQTLDNQAVDLLLRAGASPGSLETHP